MKYILLLWISLLIQLMLMFNIKSYAQTKNLTFTTPDVSSLYRFSENPVSQYTGIPNISIPLLEIAIGDIFLPISISYHAGGNKVEDRASSVGLGWALNCGGSICREIRGIADEKQEGFRTTGLSTVFNITSNYRPLYTHSYLLSNYLFGFDLTGDQRCQLREISFHRLDSESDIYSYNIPNLSGKFCLNNYSEPLLMPHENINVIYDNGKWSIIDSKGIKYTFGLNDAMGTHGLYPFHYDSYYISNWYLTEIEDCYQNKIKFYYHAKNSITYSLHSENIAPSSDLEIKSNWVQNDAQFYILDSIITSIQKVKFDYSNDSFDLNNVVLNSIKSFNNANQCIKIVELEHNYFIGTPTSFYTPFSDPYAHYRLKLTKIKVNEDNYTFSYNNLNLPSRHSKSKDVWGYYNGADNWHLIPNYFSYDEELFFDGADRCPNEETVQASILNKISLPTGGSIEYEYESNDVWCKEFDNNPTLVKYDKIVTNYPESGSYNINTNNCINIPFNVVFGQLKTNILIDFIVYPNNWPSWWEDIKFQLLNSQGDTVTGVFLLPESQLNDCSLSPGSYTLKLIGLQNYSVYTKITITSKKPITPISQNYDPYVNKIVGGLRIKSIKTIDDNSVSIKNYKYIQEKDPSKSSGVVYKFPKFHLKDRYSFTTYPSCYTEYTPTLDRTIFVSHSSIPIISENINLVEYSTVIEENGNNQEFGKTVSTFSTSLTNPDFVLNADYDFETSPYTSISWARGQLLSKKIYSNTSQLVQKINNFYTNITSYNESPNSESHNQSVNIALKDKAGTTYHDGTFHWYLCSSFNQPDICPIDVVFWRPYLNVTGCCNLDSTHTVYFFNNDSIVEKSYFNYSSLYTSSKIKLKKQKTLLSDGSFEEILYSYPFDYKNIIGNQYGIQNLINKHVIDVPIEIVTYNNLGGSQTLISSEFYTYYENLTLTKQKFKRFNDNTHPFIPCFVNNGQIVKDTYYEFYESFSYLTNGNLCEFLDISQIPSSYIWGYNSNYPIASVHNAFNHSIGYTSFENNEVNDWIIYPTNNKITDKYAVSGKNSILVTNGFGPTKRLKVGMDAKIHSGYQASVWVRGDKKAYLHIEANSFSYSQRIENPSPDDTWHLIKVVLPIDKYESIIDANLVISAYVGNNGPGEAYFDDLRVYPLDSEMTTFTYEPLIGITSISDINNKQTKYNYDEVGRLNYIIDFEGNIRKKLDYHYKNQ